MTKPKHEDRFGDGFESYPFYDIPEEWIAGVDSALDEIFAIAPNTKIHQIKIKFNELRLYLAPHVDDNQIYNRVNAIVARVESECSEAS